MGSSVQPESMAQMLQMITSLGDLQMRKQQLAQGASQFKQSLALEAQKLGFDQENTNWNKVQTLLKNISDHSTGASSAIIELGQLAHLQPGQIQQLQKFALTAPQTAEAIRNQSAASGAQAMTPQQQAPLNQEAATTAMTGMNQGQLSQSQLLATIAGRAQQQLGAPAAAPNQPSMLDASATGLLGGMTQPMAGATSFTGAMTPGLSGAAATNAAGTTMTAASAAQNKVETLTMIANNQMQQAQQAIALAGLARRQSLDPAEAVTALKTMSELAAQASDPKMEPSTRAIVWSTYNSIARRIDPSGSEGLMQTDPSAKNAGSIQTQINKFIGANTPASTVPQGALPAGQVLQQMPMPQQPVAPGIIPLGGRPQ